MAEHRPNLKRPAERPYACRPRGKQAQTDQPGREMTDPLNIYGVECTIYINTGRDSNPSNYTNFGATSNSADATLAARHVAQIEFE